MEEGWKYGEIGVEERWKRGGRGVYGEVEGWKSLKRGRLGWKCRKGWKGWKEVKEGREKG